MNFVLEILLWPVVVFLQAVVGVLSQAKTPKMVMYQKIARLALFASVGFFCVIPLFLLAASPIGIQPLLALGVVFLVVFIVFGNLCDNQARDDDRGESGERD